MLRILAEADEESRAAAHWYDQQLPGLGDEFLNELEAALELIEGNPDRFARLEATSAKRNIRRYVLDRFPYLVIFQILETETVVLAVAHASRRPGYWRRRKP